MIKSLLACDDSNGGPHWQVNPNGPVDETNE